MKFIVDEMPDLGYDCPFFCRGYCHPGVPFDSGCTPCTIFNEYGHEKIGTTKDMCYCLKVLEVDENNESAT
jgi:hypothetical protein